MPSLLAVDISTVTGIAHWRDTRKAPVCDTWKLPKVVDPADYGSRTWALMQRMTEYLGAVEAIDGIAFEAPFIPMGMFTPKDGESAFNTTMHTLRLQISLASTVELVAKRFKIRCVEVATQSAKKALIGFGRAPKGAKNWDWKREMLIAATRAGYRVSNDHEADAIAVGKVAADHFWGIVV